MEALRARAQNAAREFSRELHTDFLFFFWGFRCRERCPHFWRDVEPGQPRHSLKAGHAGHRHDSGDKRNAHAGEPGALIKARIVFWVEEELRYGEVRAQALFSQQDIDVLISIG